MCMQNKVHARSEELFGDPVLEREWHGHAAAHDIECTKRKVTPMRNDADIHVALRASQVRRRGDIILRSHGREKAETDPCNAMAPSWEKHLAKVPLVLLFLAAVFAVVKLEVSTVRFDGHARPRLFYGSGYDR